METIVDLQDIHCSYLPGTKVLEGVGLSARAGEVVGLLGKNGAGKTTLLRIAMGMLHADSGAVRLFGLDPWQRPLDVKRRVGYVAEDQILPEYLWVGEVIDLHRRLFPTWDEKLERELCERFEIPRGTQIHSLSKGQARQVAVLCAVAHRPKLLILDEPGGGLDPAARRDFLEAAVQLLSDGGTTILFSSHHMNDVERMAQRVVLLDEGRVLFDEELDRLREDYSLAVLPVGDGKSADTQLRLTDCLRVREKAPFHYAVFQAPPERCRAILERELGRGDMRVDALTLEELFVEVVRGSGPC